MRSGLHAVGAVGAERLKMCPTFENGAKSRSLGKLEGTNFWVASNTPGRKSKFIVQRAHDGAEVLGKNSLRNDRHNARGAAPAWDIFFGGGAFVLLSLV